MLPWTLKVLQLISKTKKMLYVIYNVYVYYEDSELDSDEGS